MYKMIEGQSEPESVHIGEAEVEQFYAAFKGDIEGLIGEYHCKFEDDAEPAFYPLAVLPEEWTFKELAHTVATRNTGMFDDFPNDFDVAAIFQLENGRVMVGAMSSSELFEVCDECHDPEMTQNRSCAHAEDEYVYKYWAGVYTKEELTRLDFQSGEVY